MTLAMKRPKLPGGEWLVSPVRSAESSRFRGAASEKFKKCWGRTGFMSWNYEISYPAKEMLIVKGHPDACLFCSVRSFHPTCLISCLHWHLAFFGVGEIFAEIHSAA